MFEALKNLFGFGPKVEFAELVKQGAIIVAVRSKGEYAGGHIKGSINIPVDQLGKNLQNLKNKNKPIITCCASGMRSASGVVRLVEISFITFLCFWYAKRFGEKYLKVKWFY